MVIPQGIIRPRIIERQPGSPITPVNVKTEIWDEKKFAVPAAETVAEIRQQPLETVRAELELREKEKMASATSLAGDWVGLGASAPASSPTPDVTRDFEAVAGSIPDVGATPPAGGPTADPNQQIIEGMRVEVVRENLQKFLRVGVDIPFNFAARRFGEKWALTEEEREATIECLIPVIEINMPRIMALMQKVGQPEYIFAATVISSILLRKWFQVSESEPEKKRATMGDGSDLPKTVGRATPEFSGSPVAANRGFASDLSNPAAAS